MPARVYECDKSEAEARKKFWNTTFTLILKLIPPSKSDKDLKLMSEEDRKNAAEEQKKVEETIKRLHEDKYANAIFARQEYSFRDGAVLNLDSSKSYLYLNANDQFLGLVEERFKKEFKTIKRVEKNIEDKVIGTIKAEEEKANAGFGSIFGGV